MQLYKRSSSVAVAIAIAHLIILAPIVWLYRGVLAARVFYFEDIAAYFGPLWTACARTMREGRLPTHMLETFAGQPLLGDPQLGIFYPPHWLWVWIAPVRLYAWSIVLHTVLGRAGAYLLS